MSSQFGDERGTFLVVWWTLNYFWRGAGTAQSEIK